jgi:epoxyqueuosine reductase
LDLTKNDWQDLQKETFDSLFKNSAVKRTKFEGLKRNIQFIKLDKS